MNDISFHLSTKIYKANDLRDLSSLNNKSSLKTSEINIIAVELK